MWRDWPRRVCDAAGCRGLVYSRYGYGRSTVRPLDESRPIDYLHQQAAQALPALFAALGIDARRDKPVLFGHSDGASIALLYAALCPDAVAGIAVAAPHIYVEDITVANIAVALRAYRETTLRDRLARYHDDVDSTFASWTDTWLDPAFRQWNIEAYLPAITCPVLAMQGVDDEYGTLEQIRGIRRLAPQTRLLEIQDCGHSPHKDQPELVTRAGRIRGRAAAPGVTRPAQSAGARRTAASTMRSAPASCCAIPAGRPSMPSRVPAGW